MTTAAPYYQDEHVTVLAGDCLEVLRSLPDASVHAVVTDPPYGLEFMGKGWDAPWQAGKGTGEHNAGFSPGAPAVPGVRGEIKSLPSYTGSTNPTCRNCGGTRNGNDRVGRRACRCDSPEFPNTTLPRMRAFQDWCEQWATECLRVLKPGGHMLAFGGSRTWHRLAVAIEDAGFEVRDSIAWLYGSGFPKSLNVAKTITGAQLGHGSNSRAIRRATMGEDYEPSGVRGNRDGVTRRSDTGMADRDLPLTADAEQWAGWGTALKPAFEPIVVARKPLTGTVAANVLEHGTGALNIDATRTATSDTDKAAINAKHAGMDPDSYVRKPGDSLNLSTNPMPLVQAQAHDAGRWPTNVLLDDTQAAELDRQAPATGSWSPNGAAYAGSPHTDSHIGGLNDKSSTHYGDMGGASRFFPTFRYEAKAPTEERPRVNGIAHPTVKPLDLMRWLVRLVTPPGGTILDPFAGSGTTLEAALIEGFQCIGIEREDDYLPLIKARITKPLEPVLDLGGIA